MRLGRRGPGELSRQDARGTKGGWAMAIKKGQPELKKQVDAFIREYRAAGKFEILEKKYLADMKKVYDQAGVPSFFDVSDSTGK